VGIHPTALVDASAKLGADVTIGPFAIIEAGVVLGDRCTIEAFAIIKSGTVLGDDNHIFERATIGGPPQHLRCPPQTGGVVIGSGNTIRENSTVHCALEPHHNTIVGDHNYMMVGAHVAHDCVVGSHAIFANNATLGGHVVVEDRAYISGNVAVHQFCRIGTLAMVGGLARVVKDVPPFVTIDGVTSNVVGLNSIGLRRAGYTTGQIAELKKAYRTIYRSGLTWREIIETLQRDFTAEPSAHFGRFLPQVTRGIVQERRMPPGSTLKFTEEAVPEPQLRVAGA
jgi:UDP-N-acetylglucosamine acyltransferase